jgi:hypothetical protein
LIRFNAKNLISSLNLMNFNAGSEDSVVGFEFGNQCPENVLALQGAGKDFAVFPLEERNAVLFKKADGFRVRKGKQCRFDESALLRTAIVVEKFVDGSAVCEITLSRTGETQFDSWSAILFENNDLFAALLFFAKGGGDSTSKSPWTRTEYNHYDVKRKRKDSKSPPSKQGAEPPFASGSIARQTSGSVSKFADMCQEQTKAGMERSAMTVNSNGYAPLRAGGLTLRCSLRYNGAEFRQTLSTT